MPNMLQSSRILGQQPRLGFSRATNQEVSVWRLGTLVEQAR